MASVFDGYHPVKLCVPRPGTFFSHASGGRLVVDEADFVDWVVFRNLGPRDGESRDLIEIEHLVPDSQGEVHRLVTYFDARRMWDLVRREMLIAEEDFFAGPPPRSRDLRRLLEPTSCVLDGRKSYPILWMKKDSGGTDLDGQLHGPCHASILREKYLGVCLELLAEHLDLTWGITCKITIGRDLYSGGKCAHDASVPLFTTLQPMVLLWQNWIRLSPREELPEDLWYDDRCPFRFEETYESYPFRASDGTAYEVQRREHQFPFPYIFEAAGLRAEPQAGVLYRPEGEDRKRGDAIPK